MPILQKIKLPLPYDLIRKRQGSIYLMEGTQHTRTKEVLFSREQDVGWAYSHHFVHGCILWAHSKIKRGVTLNKCHFFFILNKNIRTQGQLFQKLFRSFSKLFQVALRIGPGGGQGYQ